MQKCYLPQLKHWNEVRTTEANGYLNEFLLEPENKSRKNCSFPNVAPTLSTDLEKQFWSKEGTSQFEDI
jgi:hypothetical protein